ncbi:MAG TPA: hypothetical protein VFF40_10625 [Acidimicrobiia bacterium]|nr:hypothetical protein [Acidimicrobiia bacterium]
MAASGDGPDDAPGVLTVLDAQGEAVHLDAIEVETLLAFTDGLEPATVSACAGCRSRVLAAVAFVELLASGPPHARGAALIDLAEEAPTLHLYVVDHAQQCRHRMWRDPGHEEWADVVPTGGTARPGLRGRPGLR